MKNYQLNFPIKLRKIIFNMNNRLIPKGIMS